MVEINESKFGKLKYHEEEVRVVTVSYSGFHNLLDRHILLVFLHQLLLSFFRDSACVGAIDIFMQDVLFDIYDIFRN